MQSRAIKKLGHPVLRQVAPEITEITNSEIFTINRMKLALSSAEGWAIAANQIGEPKRIFVYNIHKKFETIINPILTEFTDEYWEYNEGCLSIPNYYFSIWRPRKVFIRGIDENGNNVELEAQDLQARIFQHEVDHLNGKLVIDQLSVEERKEFMEKWKMNSPHRKKKKK